MAGHKTGAASVEASSPTCRSEARSAGGDARNAERAPTIRLLADYLERHPEALLVGKQEDSK